MKRERSTTSGGPRKKNKTDELSALLSGITEHQQLLDGIKHNDHLDCSDEELGIQGKHSKETKLLLLLNAVYSTVSSTRLFVSYSVLFFQRKVI